MKSFSVTLFIQKLPPVENDYVGFSVRCLECGSEHKIMGVLNYNNIEERY